MFEENESRGGRLVVAGWNVWGDREVVGWAKESNRRELPKRLRLTRVCV